MHASLKICTLMQAYLLLTHGFVFTYAISCYCAEKNGSWRAITVQMKDRRGLSSDKQGSPSDHAWQSLPTHYGIVLEANISGKDPLLLKTSNFLQFLTRIVTHGIYLVLCCFNECFKTIGFFLNATCLLSR